MPATINTLSFFVHRTRQIYTLPAVALEVLELADHPRVDCRKIKDCIEHDPALVSKILRVVNSSLFGLGSDVTDLNQALALLGIKSLKLLVLGFSLSEAMFSGRTSEAMQHAWRHTLSRAVAARELCEFTWRVAGDEAFTAGLLAGLGRFVLLDEIGDAYADLLVAGIKDQQSLAILEQASLGFDSTDLSAELLSHWNLPEPLVAAVRLSTRPEQIAALNHPEILLPAAVRMAGLIADLVVDDRHGCLRELIYDPLSPTSADDTALDKLRLSEAALSQLMARVQDRVGALAEALSFELPPGKDYRDVLAEAHERLSLVASDAACAVARQWPIAERSGGQVAGVSTAVARYINRYADDAEPARPRPLGTAAASEIFPARQSTERSTGMIAEPPGTAPPDARLLDRLTTVVGICRQARCSLSLVLFEVDHFRNLELAYGAVEARNFVRRLYLAAARTDHPGAVCMQLAEARFALVIAGCERRSAVLVGQQLIHAMPSLVSLEKSLPDPPTLSVGLATVSMPSKNFPPNDLLKAATRCLDAAHLSGGNTLKSIDVY